jgi:NTP pyrophosphatase (non-canonical NTP hydrolase)
MVDVHQIREAIDSFGVAHNVNMCTEECAELIVALNHYRRNRCTKGDVFEEIADVKIMLDIVLEILDPMGDHSEYLNIERMKVNRMMTRVEDERKRLKAHGRTY